MEGGDGDFDFDFDFFLVDSEFVSSSMGDAARDEDVDLRWRDCWRSRRALRRLSYM